MGQRKELGASHGIEKDLGASHGMGKDLGASHGPGQRGDPLGQQSGCQRRWQQHWDVPAPKGYRMHSEELPTTISCRSQASTTARCRLRGRVHLRDPDPIKPSPWDPQTCSRDT